MFELMEILKSVCKLSDNSIKLAESIWLTTCIFIFYKSMKHFEILNQNEKFNMSSYSKITSQ